MTVELAIQGTFTGPFNWPGGVIHPTSAKLDVPCACRLLVHRKREDQGVQLPRQHGRHVQADGRELVSASDGAESSAAAS